MSPFITILLLSAAIALIAAFVLKKSGYTFLRSLITWFLATAGVLSLIYRLLKDYL